MSNIHQTQQEKLERMDWELWVLAIAVISILAFGLILFMFPAVFGEQEGAEVTILQKSFFGFCILILLLNVYLIQRQAGIRKLRRTLREEQSRNIALRMQLAAQDLMASLPGEDRFEDALAMEFRRARGANSPISLLGIRVTPAATLTERQGQMAALGDSAKALLGKLRKEDGIFHWGDGVFGIILPGIDPKEASAVKKRMEGTLSDVSGAAERFAHDVQLATYPKDADSMHRLKELAKIGRTASVATLSGTGNP